MVHSEGTAGGDHRVGDVVRDRHLTLQRAKQLQTTYETRGGMRPEMRGDGLGGGLKSRKTTAKNALGSG